MIFNIYILIFQKNLFGFLIHFENHTDLQILLSEFGLFIAILFTETLSAPLVNKKTQNRLLI